MPVLLMVACDHEPFLDDLFDDWPHHERKCEVVSVDFSAAGEGDMSPGFFADEGVVFPEDSFVGFVQGDQALVSEVAGRFTDPASNISARIAPALQGTATYTLAAYSARGDLVGSVSKTVTQDIGEADTEPPGYFDLTLSAVSHCARSFTVESELVRSTFPSVTSMPFGASTITFTRGCPCAGGRTER